MEIITAYVSNPVNDVQRFKYAGDFRSYISSLYHEYGEVSVIVEVSDVYGAYENSFDITSKYDVDDASDWVYDVENIFDILQEAVNEARYLEGRAKSGELPKALSNISKDYFG